MKVKVYIMKVWVWLTERVGVAYSWGCIVMFDDSLDTPPSDCSWYMLPWLPALENSADIIHVEQTTPPSLLSDLCMCALILNKKTNQGQNIQVV